MTSRSGPKVDNPYSGAIRLRQPRLAGAGQRRGEHPHRCARQPDAQHRQHADRGLDGPDRGHHGGSRSAPATSTRPSRRTRPTAQQPVVVTLVIYDLPNRDCAALASNGELLIASGGMTRYQNEYINPIRGILGAAGSTRACGWSLVIEVDSLPNLVTNLSTPKCAEANQAWRLRGRRPVRGQPAARRWPTPTCTSTSPTPGGSAGRTTSTGSCRSWTAP